MVPVASVVGFPALKSTFPESAVTVNVPVPPPVKFIVAVYVSMPAVIASQTAVGELKERSQVGVPHSPGSKSAGAVLGALR